MKNLNKKLLVFGITILLMGIILPISFAQGWEGRYQGVTGYQIIPLDNNGYLACGSSTTERFYVFQLDVDDEIEWKKEYEPNNGTFGQARDLIATSDGNFVVTGYTTINSIKSAVLIKINGLGNILWEKTFSDTNALYGKEVWIQYYGDIRNDMASDFKQTHDGGFSLIGSFTYSPLPVPLDKKIYIIKTDALGNSITNEVNGQLHYDNIENCQFDSNEMPLENWIVKAEGNNAIYLGKTDEYGSYTIRTDTGEYFLSLEIPNAYWNACFIDSLASMPTNFDTLTIDYPAQTQYECPILNVDISTPFLRSCYDNIYYVSYCNEGTTLAENASVEVVLDEFLTVNSTSIPWDSANEKTYTFNIGNVPVGDCGSFQIHVTVDCDNTELGANPLCFFTYFTRFYLPATEYTLGWFDHYC